MYLYINLFQLLKSFFDLIIFIILMPLEFHINYLNFPICFKVFIKNKLSNFIILCSNLNLEKANTNT